MSVIVSAWRSGSAEARSAGRCNQLMAAGLRTNTQIRQRESREKMQRCNEMIWVSR